MYLARHFLSRCSSQYGKLIHGFTGAAEAAMNNYSWPGNVRELRNKMIRAVILCQGDKIDSSELGLQAEDLQPATAIQQPPSGQGADSLADVESAITEGMKAQLAHCLDNDILLPLGQWLEQDLILAALELSGQVNLQAATTLGMPESTLRRKLARYRSSRSKRSPELETHWQPVIDMLPTWIRVAGREGIDPVEHLQTLLLSLVDQRATTRSDAAALIGVSAPTYRRQISQLPVR